MTPPEPPDVWPWPVNAAVAVLLALVLAAALAAGRPDVGVFAGVGAVAAGSLVAARFRNPEGTR